MNNSVNELQIYFCPFGYLDMECACEVWEAVWLYEWEIFEIIDDFRESCGYEGFSKLDPVYCVFDHILQMARNKIEELTGYDLINDFSGEGSEIYVHGNYMCSCFDYSENAKEELRIKVQGNIQELQKDKCCSYLFSELELGAI